MLSGGVNMNNTVLELTMVSKHFGHYQALQDIDLSIQRGDICALIGENGAGKTSLMRLITGLSPVDKGVITLLGENAGSYRHALEHVGAIIESPALFASLTIFQNLKIAAIQHGINDAEQITRTIKFVGLDAKAHTKAKHLSLGQKQRLGLALAVLAQPDFLVLDEPINGLDPMGIVEFRELLKRLNTEFGTTILISSHILTELYQVATRFVFLHQGRIIKQLSKDELASLNRGGLLIRTPQVTLAAQVLDAAGYTQFSVIDDTQLLLMDKNVQAAVLTKLLVDKNIPVDGITLQETSLEQYYTRLIHSQEVHHD
jgi:ABC-2 type transport system ATP-binding protein